MDGIAVLYYRAIGSFSAAPIQMINGVPIQGQPVMLPSTTIIVADPSIVVSGVILPNRIISYPVSGMGGQQMLQVAETTTPVNVSDGGI